MSDVLVTGYVTVREAVEKLCKQGRITTVDRLRAWLNDNNVQKKKIGRIIVVREADLERYLPREMK